MKKVIVTSTVRPDGGIRLSAKCSMCSAATYFDAMANHPDLPNINWPKLIEFIEAHFEGKALDITELPVVQQVAITSITGTLVPQWRDELRSNPPVRCVHV